MKEIVDLVLKNCKIVTSHGVLDAGLAVDEEKIVAIAKNTFLPRADKIIDCKGRMVIPGGVDVHVHFKAFDENWKTASESAAAGGVTYVIDHGLSDPPSTTLENYRRIVAEAKKDCIVDFSVNGSVVPRNIEEVPKLIMAGVLSFGEVYMAESVEGTETIDDGMLFDAFKLIGEHDGVVGVHAENGKIVSFLTEKLRREGRKDPSAHLEARPNFAEAEAINRAIILAREANVRLHIFHLTTREGVRLVADAKRVGQRVTAETCPHYLLFTKEDMKKHGPYIKCNPPIRSGEDRDALWQALFMGGIDMVSTDHWPSLKSKKEIGWTDIWEADSGMPGVETRIPLLLTFGVHRGKISLELFVQLVSENPARAFGAYPQKGVIAVGSDADLTVVDLKKKKRIRCDELHTTSDFTPYEGLEVRGVPAITILRGQVIMEEGEVFAKPGSGEFVKQNWSIY